jgi:hypothetical protein
MTPTAEAGVLASLLITIGAGIVIGLAIYVWYAIALSRLFPRLGGEAWKGWVPVLNEAEILSRGGKPAWAVVLYFIPIVQLYGLYLKALATHRINQQFGRGTGSTVLAILLPPVWATLLAAGPAPYPEGDRLAALQPPGPRRTPQPPFPSETDADAGYKVFADFAPQRSAADHAAARPESGFIPIPPRGSAEWTASAGSTTSIPPEWQAFAPAPSTASAAPAAAAPAASVPESPAPAPAAAPAARAPEPFASVPPASPAPPTAPPAAASEPFASVPPASVGAASAAAPQAENRSLPPTPAPPASAPAPSDVVVDPLAETVRAVPPVTPPLTTPPAAASVPVPMPLDALDADVAHTVVSPRRQPIEDDDFDETVVVARKRGVRRSLVLDDGRTYALSGARVVIGRNPVGEPGEQRLAITDLTRTLSKTHARLVVTDDEWRLTDLHATNGVIVVADDGTETLLDPGESVVGTGRFILGEVGMYVTVERDS